MQQAGYADYAPDTVTAAGTVSVASSLTLPPGDPTDPYNLDLVGAVNTSKSDVGSDDGYGTNNSKTAAGARD